MRKCRRWTLHRRFGALPGAVPERWGTRRDGAWPPRRPGRQLQPVRAVPTADLRWGADRVRGERPCPRSHPARQAPVLGTAAAFGLGGAGRRERRSLAAMPRGGHPARGGHCAVHEGETREAPPRRLIRSKRADFSGRSPGGVSLGPAMLWIIANAKLARDDEADAEFLSPRQRCPWSRARASTERAAPRTPYLPG